ncbi:hypothetical protein [Terriglobus sp. TAA 43]|uniref:hypothetical protein n=1 Tax=Terriglobus sp. TAA 43 TaxID=278961 RepID=UPI0012ED92FD|nr:hypothetical protein [Terriglobus sp. TAA 43]
MEDALGEQQVRRARLKRLRVQAMILLIVTAILGGLRYRGADLQTTESKVVWAVFVGMILLIFAGRIYYTSRRLAALEEAGK